MSAILCCDWLTVINRGPWQRHWARLCAGNIQVTSPQIWTWPRPSQQIDTAVIFQEKWRGMTELLLVNIIISVQSQCLLVSSENAWWNCTACNQLNTFSERHWDLSLVALIIPVIHLGSQNEIVWRIVRLSTERGFLTLLGRKKDTKEVLLIHLIRVFVLFLFPLLTI